MAFSVSVNPDAYMKFIGTLRGILSANCIKKGILPPDANDYITIKNNDQKYLVVWIPNNPKKLMRSRTAYRREIYYISKPLFNKIINKRVFSGSYILEFLDKEGDTYKTSYDYDSVVPCNILALGPPRYCPHFLPILHASKFEIIKTIRKYKVKITMSDEEIKSMSSCRIHIGKPCHQQFNHDQHFRCEEMR